MTVIILPKEISEIQEPEALPEDYYRLRIVEEPLVEDNKKKKEGGADAPGAGQNLILLLRVISDIPEHNGRPFKKWLSLPTEADRTDVTAMGQTKEDFKISILARVQAGFSGAPVEGNEITLESGQEAWCYISRKLAPESSSMNNLDYEMAAGTRIVNELDFMAEIKPIDNSVPF